MDPVVSVVVPVYNGEKIIGRCVRALEGQSLPRARYEIVVVDDGSTDGTVAALAGSTARLVRQDNAGPATARNTGVAAARGSIVVFTDADCVADERFLEKVIEPLLAQPEAVVAAQALYRTRQRSWIARLVQVEIEERYDHIRLSSRLTGIGTYGAAYWKEAVEAVGGFDATYRAASGEDFALSYELTRNGRQAVLAPEAITFHEHPATVSAYWRSKFSRGYWRILLRIQYPTESIQDSYVPGSLLAQVALLATFPLVLTGSIWLLAHGQGSGALLPIALHGAALAVAGRDFIRSVWIKERTLAPAALPFLWLRGAALASGLAAGVVAFQLRPMLRAFARDRLWPQKRGTSWSQ